VRELGIAELEGAYAHAYALYQAGQEEKAANVFELLCSMRPIEMRFWFGLAASRQESAEYQQAMNAWAMCAMLEPENPYPHFHAAECATSLNHKEDALLALHQAKSLLTGEHHPLSPTIEALEERWRLQ